MDEAQSILANKLTVLRRPWVLSGCRAVRRYCYDQSAKWPSCAAPEVVRTAVQGGCVASLEGATYEESTGELQDITVEWVRCQRRGRDAAVLPFGRSAVDFSGDRVSFVLLRAQRPDCEIPS